MYARHTAARTGLHKVLCWPMCTRFIMNSEFSVSQLSAPLIALFVTFAALHAPVQAAEDSQGDRGVIRVIRRSRRFSARGNGRSANC